MLVQIISIAGNIAVGWLLKANTMQRYHTDYTHSMILL
jgi:hypothetical protein